MTARRQLRPVPDTPPRAVIYIRQSIAREESISDELQETAARDHCTRNGYTVVDVIKDLGVSGRTFRRAGVTRVMQLVENGDADVIVLWKWSRLSRSRKDWALAADRVEVAGGRIESATEPVDVATSTGRLTRGMLTELAAWESDVKSEQWKEAQARRRAMGLPHNGGRRFGYLYDKQTGYTPDRRPDGTGTGDILEQLYRRYIAGEGFQHLAVWLNRNGISTMRSGLWAPGTVIRHLDSGFAAGLLSVAVGWTSTGRAVAWEHRPGAHEPLIDAKTWQAYLARRGKQRKLPNRARNATYVLTGLVFCGECGKSMKSTTTSRGRGYLYRCITSLVTGMCPGVWITRSRTEQAVVDWLRPLAEDGGLRAATKTARVAAAATARADRQRLAREVTKLDRALAGLLTDRALADAGQRRAFEVAIEELTAARAEVVERLAAAEREVDENSGSHTRAVRELLDGWDFLPTTVRRDMLGRIVARVEIHRGRPSTVRVVGTWETVSP